ncbi:MAG: hypothetical protein BWY77_00822 [bacterium ADurb.Bin431]|nr:MAG: hypothetical protein BWY77_00822 [bacterium ADurb.Bin431]
MEGFDADLEGYIAVDGGEGTGEARQVGVLLQGGALFFRFDGIDLFEQGLERAETLEQSEGAHRADAGHPGDVV